MDNILTEKYKDMIKDPDFEQNYWSRRTTGIKKIGHDNIRLMKRICSYDRSFNEKIIYFDLMGIIVRKFTQV